MEDMSAGDSGQDFVLTITDVFSITGRGTAVNGPIESGALRTGETVEVWDENRLITTARATVELICSRRADPRNVSLMLGDIDVSLLRAGETIRRPVVTA